MAPPGLGGKHHPAPPTLVTSDLLPPRIIEALGWLLVDVRSGCTMLSTTQSSFTASLSLPQSRKCGDWWSVSFLILCWSETLPNLRCISSMLCLWTVHSIAAFRSAAIAKTGCENDDAEIYQKLFETSKHRMMGFSYVNLIVHHNSHMCIMRREIITERKKGGRTVPDMAI